MKTSDGDIMGLCNYHINYGSFIDEDTKKTMYGFYDEVFYYEDDSYCDAILNVTHFMFYTDIEDYLKTI